VKGLLIFLIYHENKEYTIYPIKSRFFDNWRDFDYLDYLKLILGILDFYLKMDINLK
jgi:hypothetical protein